MCDIKVILASKNHINDMVKISEESLAIPWSFQFFEEEFKNKFSRYVVALCDDKVVGFGGCWIIVGEGNITNIAVSPEYRGKGIGSAIVKELLRICHKENGTAITLEVRRSNIIAQNLYKKFGFEVEGIRKGYYANNKEDALLMWNRSLESFI